MSCKGNIHTVQRLDRLQESLHFIGVPAQNRHTVFVDSSSAAQSFSAEAHFDTPAPLLGRAFNRPRAAQLDAAAAIETDAAEGATSLQSTTLACKSVLVATESPSARHVTCVCNPLATAAPDRAAARQAKRRAGAYQRLLDAKESSQKLEQLVGELRAARVAGSAGRRRPVREKGDAGKVVGQRFKRVRQR